MLEVPNPHDCHILLVTQTNPDTMWEGYNVQGHENQEVRIIKEPLRNWLLQELRLWNHLTNNSTE